MRNPLRAAHARTALLLSLGLVLSACSQPAAPAPTSAPAAAAKPTTAPPAATTAPAAAAATTPARRRGRYDVRRHAPLRRADLAHRQHRQRGQPDPGGLRPLARYVQQGRRHQGRRQALQDRDQVLRRRQQRPAERDAGREADQRGQGQLPARPLRHQLDAAGQHGRREEQDADDRGRMARPKASSARATSTPSASWRRRKNYLRGVVDLALAQDPKPTTVAVLSADDPFSVEVADAAKAYAEQKGLQVVYYQKYPNASTDLRAPLTETKAKNPDLFLNSGHLQESVAIMQQAKELGFSPKGLGFSVGPSIPDFETTLKGDVELRDGRHAVDARAEVPGRRPVQDARGLQQPVQADVQLRAVVPERRVDRLRAWPTSRRSKRPARLDPDKVRDAIAKLEFHVVLRPDQVRRARHQRRPSRWPSSSGRTASKVTVWPADVADAKPIWPVPAWSAR